MIISDHMYQSSQYLLFSSPGDLHVLADGLSSDTVFRY